MWNFTEIDFQLKLKMLEGCVETKFPQIHKVSLELESIHVETINSQDQILNMVYIIHKALNSLSATIFDIKSFCYELNIGPLYQLFKQIFGVTAKSIKILADTSRYGVQRNLMRFIAPKQTINSTIGTQQCISSLEQPSLNTEMMHIYQSIQRSKHTVLNIAPSYAASRLSEVQTILNKVLKDYNQILEGAAQKDNPNSQRDVEDKSFNSEYLSKVLKEELWQTIKNTLRNYTVKAIAKLHTSISAKEHSKLLEDMHIFKQETKNYGVQTDEDKQSRAFAKERRLVDKLNKELKQAITDKNQMCEQYIKATRTIDIMNHRAEYQKKTMRTSSQSNHKIAVVSGEKRPSAFEKEAIQQRQIQVQMQLEGYEGSNNIVSQNKQANQHRIVLDVINKIKSRFAYNRASQRNASRTRLSLAKSVQIIKLTSQTLTSVLKDEEYSRENTIPDKNKTALNHFIQQAKLQQTETGSQKRPYNLINELFCDKNEQNLSLSNYIDQKVSNILSPQELTPESIQQVLKLKDQQLLDLKQNQLSIIFQKVLKLTKKAEDQSSKTHAPIEEESEFEEREQTQLNNKKLNRTLTASLQKQNQKRFKFSEAQHKLQEKNNPRLNLDELQSENKIALSRLMSTKQNIRGIDRFQKIEISKRENYGRYQSEISENKQPKKIKRMIRNNTQVINSYDSPNYNRMIQVTKINPKSRVQEIQKDKEGKSEDELSKMITVITAIKKFNQRKQLSQGYENEIGDLKN